LALQSAEATPHAATRRLHLARAVALAVQPSRPRAWLEVLLLLVEWDVQCGRLDLLRAPLAEAQGLLADLRADLGDPLRLRAELAMAWAETADGRAQEALHRLGRCQPHSGRRALAVHALTLRAMVAAGRAGEGATTLAAADLASAAPADAAAVALAQAEAALAIPHQAWRAGHAAWMAHAHAATAGDPLLTAAAHVILGRLALQQERWPLAERHATDAQSLLAPVGWVAVTVEAAHLMAAIRARQGQTAEALRMWHRAETWAEELQLGAPLRQIRDAVTRIQPPTLT
jgi:hypothetical protein